jgi:hypothetical protein
MCRVTGPTADLLELVSRMSSKQAAVTGYNHRGLAALGPADHYHATVVHLLHLPASPILVVLQF